MDKKIKVAVIGNGGISGVHLNGYHLNPNVEIYALCDINPERVNQRGDQYNVPAERRFTNVYEMLEKCPEIDACSVCTWNAAHAECTIAALNASKHVLCEKPMAMNEQEAKAMKEAAEKNGKLLMIGFVRRFGNDCAIVQDFSKNDFFGDMYYAKANYRRRKGAPGGWFGDKTRSGGGPLIDLGVHVIDLVRYLMGGHKPVSVYGATFYKLGDKKNIKDKAGYSSAGRSNEDIFNVEDLASAMIRFDNGSVLQVETSFTLNQEEISLGTIELFGTKGGAKMDPGLKLFTDMSDYMANVELTAPTALSFEGLFENEINHFVDCVINGTPCRAPAEDGVTLMKILDGIYESARTGHEVILED